MRRLAATTLLVLLLSGCAATASTSAKSGKPDQMTGGALLGAFPPGSGGGSAGPAASGGAAAGSGSVGTASTGSAGPGHTSGVTSTAVPPAPMPAMPIPTVGCPGVAADGSRPPLNVRELAASVRVVGVLRCVIRTSADGRSQVRVTQRSASDPTALVAALRLPSIPGRPQLACPMYALNLPSFALVLSDGRTVVPGLPTTSCAQPRAEALIALSRLVFVDVSSQPVR